MPAPVNRHSGQELTPRQDGQAADCAHVTQTLSLSACYNSPSSIQQSIKKFTISCSSSGRGRPKQAVGRRQCTLHARRCRAGNRAGAHLQGYWPLKLHASCAQQLLIGGVQGYGLLPRCLLGFAATIRRIAACSPLVPPQPSLLRPGLGACRRQWMQKMSTIALAVHIMQ